MARNEEKQLGKLNRLWLQRERDEGRIKNIHEGRPRLSCLNSAPAVKKWIPSIKNEIEYYLQQSQLSHYPERKIAEFQRHVEDLGQEYKRFLRKLRALDPSCRHQPWTLRGYSKRRRLTDGSGCRSQTECEGVKTLLTPILSESAEPAGEESDSETDLDGTVAGDPPPEVSPARPGPDPAPDLPGQDRPLSFDLRKMPLKFTGRPAGPGEENADSLARVLFLGLPNLRGSSAARAVETHNAPPGEKEGSDPSAARPPTEPRPHVLGLDCYSSSEDDA
ncbi:uncharacterized protein LOC136714630 [Amia ocellicauda]|uniref:uncharacterized protein LOC136714630 n=1 Tax=Amia ocellicauda TaxID=2972642 RepID=UPI003464ADC9